MEGRLTRPIEEVREELLADPNTQQIAKNLGVELEEYVEEVLFFATQPDAEPDLRYIEDEKWRAQGVTPASEEDVLSWLAVAARADAFGKTVEEKRKLAIDEMFVLDRTQAAPRVDAGRGRVIVRTGSREVEKQVLNARMNVQMNLEKMRARSK